MGIGTIIVLGILAAIVVYAIMLYNNLVQIKHNVGKAWANIDVLLKQRHDELPKLVETCKQYMKFEQETLTRVMEARSKVFAAREAQNIPQLGQAEGALRATLGNLFALAEAYPDLKTNQTFQQLQTRISGLENAIARYFVTGQAPEPLGTRHPSATPFQAFPTADGYLVIALAFGALVLILPLVVVFAEAFQPGTAEGLINFLLMCSHHSKMR